MTEIENHSGDALAALNANGVVLAVRCSMLGITAKMNEGLLSPEAQGRKMRITSELINRDFLQPIGHEAHLARKAVVGRSVLFMKSIMSGIYWTNRNLLASIQEEFTRFSDRFDVKVDEFRRRYHYREGGILREAQDRLGSYFNEADYPSLGEVSGRFNLRLAVFQFHGVPGLDQGELASMVDEFKDDVTVVLRTEFAKLLGKVTERLTPEMDDGTGELKNKHFKNSLVTNLTEFLNNASHLNISNDVQLRENMERVKALIAERDINASTLREDGELRAIVRANFAEVSEVFSEAIAVESRRKVRRRRRSSTPNEGAA